MVGNSSRGAGGGGHSAQQSGSRLSGKSRAPQDDRNAKRYKTHTAYSIKRFLQPLGPAAGGAGGRQGADRDSSEEPEDQLPSQTPAVSGMQLGGGGGGGGPAMPQSSAPTAAGAMLQTALLRSLQHRFATQQALETPALLAAAAAGGATSAAAAAVAAAVQGGGQQRSGDGGGEGIDDDGDDDDDDGFQIFSQLAYEPTFLSQRPPELPPPLPDGATADASQAHTQTQEVGLAPCGSEQGVEPPEVAAVDGTGQQQQQQQGDGEGGGGDGSGMPEWGASQLQSQPPIAPPSGEVEEELAGRLMASGAGGAAGAPHKTTPALHHSAERVRCDGDRLSDQKMFPLFRRRDSLKRLYIVRHGESAYNAAMHARGSSWADPMIFDAPLTELGRSQAAALRKELAALGLPPDTLWVTSPLQRAMQTLLLALPCGQLGHSVGSSSGGGGGCGGAAHGGDGGEGRENSSAVPNGGGGSSGGGSGGGGGAPEVVVLHTITEKVVTSGDIGHPASELRRRFPQLDAQLATLPELWWYSPPDKPNCAVQQRFGSHESKEQVKARVGAFRRWLQERPEPVIVAVGHSSYWRSFEEVCRGGTKPSHMRNCEFRLIHF